MTEPLSNQTYHVPVMLHEVLEGLQVKPDGVYVDCTFGGGGHSKAILNALGPNGRLFVFDQDADAQKNVPNDARVIFVPENFRCLKKFLRLYKCSQVDGLLADLGVSSHQFDVPERGFSIRFDAVLDMRMDQRQPVQASSVLATYTEHQLHQMFEKYGEVTNSKTLAQTIVAHRKHEPIKTVEQFKQLLSGVVRGNPHKYYAQVFQALRIEVNDEMGALKDMLEQLNDLFVAGGRVAIITFHSIEDRIVKQFFKNGTTDMVEEDALYGRVVKSQWKSVHKKPLEPVAAEVKNNPRSRSAKLRVAEKK